MIKQNYNTHTSRCGHAIGKDEEYVQEAISFGLNELGFSDHIMLPDHPQPGIRGDYALLPDYISSIESLREKYKERIKIYLGFEAEALPYYFPYYQRLLDEGHIQYLICGNHCEIDKDNNLKWYFSKFTTADDIKRYTKSLVKGIKTGLFAIVAHPDYYMGSYTKWDQTCIDCAKQIIRAAKKYNVHLEFNFGAIRGNKKIIGDEFRYGYPVKQFWELAKKMKAKICIGIDAHSPLDISNDANDNGYKMALDLGLKLDQKVNVVWNKEKKCYEK
jgi:histidinol-phosphatase (PHP family)